MNDRPNDQPNDQPAHRTGDRPDVVFVLGGGGPLGAHEVGMLQALVERGVRPDAIVGTSIGALNGAVVAADPSVASIERLGALWASVDRSGVLGGSVIDQMRTIARTRTHLQSNDGLREIVERALDVELIEDLAVRFECVAASIERATVQYFSRGPVVDAILASTAIPGILPPVEIDGEHYLDGGLVASIPLDRAIALGATTVYVLQVGRIETPLRAPQWPWEVAMVAFEISRRHRFTETMSRVPDSVSVHVLPTGEPKEFTDLKQYRTGRGAVSVEDRIRVSYEASTEYLDGLDR